MTYFVQNIHICLYIHTCVSVYTQICSPPLFFLVTNTLHIDVLDKVWCFLVNQMKS